MTRSVCALVAALALVIGSVNPPAIRAEPWDGPDKRLHLVAGVTVAANGTVLARLLDLDRDQAALTGFVLGVAAGAAKEGADGLGLGTASAADFAWTALGALFGAGVTWLMSRL
jgi:uncharacterized protein YfiM (DUF2279 family)